MNEDIHTNVILMGRYQVQRELGHGGMGAVYLAFDLQFRKQVAIKVARLAGPEARAQFRREALYLQRLRHHNLPQVLDVFSDTQRDFLVMEYIPGDDLETLVQQQGPQPEWLVLRWADELLDVLDYLHTQSPPIIHRDVKPGNLKLRQNDTLVLVDFGIAKEYMPEGDTYVGATAVTPGFSPPEQYSDMATDERTDVYSAGATLYYLLTGRAPAAAPDRAAGRATVAPVSALAPQTSQASDMLVGKAFSLVSEERWANAAEMRRAAVVAARKLASTAPLPPVPAPAGEPMAAGGAGTAPRRSKGSLGLAGVAALVGVALLAAAALLWTISNRPPGAASAPGPGAATATAVVEPAVEPAAVVEAAQPAADLATASLAEATSVGATPTVSVVETTPAATEPAEEEGPVAVAATSTRIPTRTPTPAAGTALRTATAQATPSPTRRGAGTPSVGTTAATGTAQPTATARPPATATPAPLAAVTLVEPAAGAVGGGERLFRWQASQGLSGSQAFELVFWRPGQDALRDSFGLVGVTQQASDGMRINLDEADVTLGALLDPGDYLWGVLLVETTPYRRVALLSEARAFRFERSGGGVAPPADQPPPAQPTEPPPTDTPAPPPSGSFVLTAQPRDLRHAGAGGVLGLGMFVVVLGWALWRPRRLL